MYICYDDLSWYPVPLMCLSNGEITSVIPLIYTKLSVFQIVSIMHKEYTKSLYTMLANQLMRQQHKAGSLQLIKPIQWCFHSVKTLLIEKPLKHSRVFREEGFIIQPWSFFFFKHWTVVPRGVKYKLTNKKRKTPQAATSSFNKVNNILMIPALKRLWSEAVHPLRSEYAQ